MRGRVRACADPARARLHPRTAEPARRRTHVAGLSRRREKSVHMPDTGRNAAERRRDYPGRMPEPIDDFYAVIPAGGIGSRLWPLSRADAPKFLHDLTGSGHTLLRDTWDRLEPLVGTRPHRRRHRPRAPRGGREGASRHPRQERLPRVRAARLRRRDRPRRRDPRRAASPTSSSARSPPTTSSACTQLFDWAVQQAVATAREGYICTIGIQPSEPSVGFGYIKKGGELVVDGAPEAALVEQLRREARSRHREGVLRRPLLPVERGHVHLPRRRAARRDRREPAAAVRRD